MAEAPHSPDPAGLPEAVAAAPRRFRPQLVWIIPIVAILTCALIYMTILAAMRAMAALRNSYHSQFSKEDHGLPEIQTATPTRCFGLSATVVLPVVFIAVWLFLWMHGMR